MADPTIVLASLSDDKLKESINSLVKHVNDKMEEMVESTNSAVKRMEAKLKSLGSLKIDSGGTNDGGAGRRTQQHEKLTKAVNDASEAVSKETQKLQDLQQSLSGASDREQNFVSQKERAANTIAQENELLSKQQSELAALKIQQQSLVDAEQRDAQAKQQNAAAIEKQRGAVKYYEEELSSLQARLTSAQAKIDRFYEVQAKARESISSRLHAPSDQFIGYNDYERGKSVYSKTEQDVRSLIKALSELDNADKKHGFGDELRRAYMNLTQSQDMANVFKRQQEEISSYIKTLQEAKKGTKGETRANLDNQILAGKELLAIYKELGNAQNALNKTVQKEGLRDGGNVGGIKRDIEETQKAYDIAKRKLDELTQTTQQSSQASQQKAQIDAQVAAKEKEIAETKGRIAAATKEQSEADKNASKAAKEKANIQSQVANQEKQVAEAKKQLTTATQQHVDAETKSSRAAKEKTMTLDQQASAINTAIQSEKKYTDEIRNQAAAIRATKEWQEKGRYWLDGTQLIDPSVYKGTRTERQAQGTLEEQLLRIQQQRTEESIKQAQSSRQYAENIRQAAQELRGLMTGKHGVSSIDVGGRAIYRDRADVTIEQQLTSLVSERGREFNLQRAVTEAIADNEKRISEELQKEVEIERKINSERQNRINTKSADFWSNAERENIVSILAQRNQIDRSRVKNWDEETSSIQTLSSALKQYQTAYQRLTTEQRSSTVGKQLIADMQVIERSIQKARAELSRPIDLESVMRLPQKTLDDIAYKMRQLASYRSGLNVETQTKEIDQVNRKYAELQKKMNEVMAKNSQMTSSNNILANSWRYMRNRLAFYLTVSTGMTLVRDLARVRSEYEMNEKALGTLLNSAERGTRIFNELSNMALLSPYTLIELSAAAKQLTAYDVAAKDVVDTTRRLADISAAVGIPVERLTYALGQVKAYGHLTSQDARQFLNAGVPLVKELANRYSELEGRLVSTADVYDRMKKHAISYNDVLSVLTSMTDEGGRFFDYQAKMAETLKVRLANLTLAYNNMLNDMGKAEGGAFTIGIKGLTQLLKHWREIERILGTVVVGIGAYRAATLLAGITTTTAVGKNAFGAWISLARGVKSAKDATALFSLTIKSIPFVGWATAIASLVSYFVLFNNSSDETKQKLQDIATAFEGIRKEATDLFADAISTDSLGTQLTKLKDMLELAETELGITIPINLEDVNDSNVKQKLREVKNTIDNYVNFSQTFSEAAVDTRFNESMTDFGTTARSTYTSVTESINTVKVALQELVDAGKASKRDIEILKELDNKPKDGESRIEYFQRLVKLYEELGLLGQKKTTPTISFFGSSEDNMDELMQKQEASLDRLGLKNKTVFETMLSDVQGYYSKSSIAAYQFEEQVERVAKSINLENIPKDERTAKLEVAINQEAAKNNWNEFAIQYAKWVANQKFGLNITISEDSKKDSEIELSDWQKRMQSWADKHGITFSLNFMEKEDEKTYADRMLQAAKDAQGKLDVLRRKLKVGTGSQSAVDDATKDYNNARLLALQAGADLSSLDKKSASSRKAASKAESELAKALKDELSTIDKVRSIYKDLTKEGMSHADAVERATRGWGETVNAINKVLQKNGLQKLDLSKFAGIENPRELVNMLQSQLDILVKRGAKAAEIKELQTKVQTLNVDAEKYDLTKITKGLNNELGKLKDEYELAVELDANPELGDMFADMFGIDQSKLVHSIDEYMRLVQDAFDKSVIDFGYGNNINLDVFAATQDSWRIWAMNVGLSEEQLEEFSEKFKSAQETAKKWTEDVIKQTKNLQYSLADTNGKIAIKEKELADLRTRYNNEQNEKQKELLRLRIQEQENAITELRAGLLQEIPEYAAVFNSIVERSDYMTRKLVANLKKIYDEAKSRGTDAKGNYTIVGAGGQTTLIGKKQFEKEYDKLTTEERKSQAPFKKIKQAFSKDSTTGLVDWAKGLELVGGELQKVQGIVGTFGNIAEAMGADPSTVEIFNDIATSIGGVSTAAQGISQIASGDYLGGAASLLSGMFTAISTWFDNDGKKIDEEIKDSELAVKRLENQYKRLQAAVEDAYGTMAYAAEKAAVYNKKLQLEEMRRQLRLEQSRDSEDRDDDKIESLKGQIIDLEREIQKATDNWINDMLGISSVGDAVEQLVSSMIDAFRQGEDYMGKFYDSFEEMIENMIMKAIASKVIGEYIETMWSNIKSRAEARSQQESQELENAQREYDEYKNSYDYLKEHENTVRALYGDEYYENWIRELEKDLKNAEARKNQALKDYEKAIMPTPSDVAGMRADAEGMSGVIKEWFDATMEEWGIAFGDKSGKNLSNLQQGIQGITEDTAGALEGYMNGISQQVYLQSEYLRQIVEFINIDADPMDDVKVASLSQILLQLQTNYTLMQTIDTRMENWSTATGNGIRVELLS